MVTLRESVKLLHFQTTSYAIHKISDQFLTTYDDLSDTFWESVQQNKFRVNLEKSETIRLHNVRNYDEISPLLNTVTRGLSRVSVSLDSGSRAAADNLIEAINKFEYLLTFT